MAQIKNVEGLSVQDIKRLVDQGGKFVVFKYCVSVLVMTFNRGTDIYFIRPGESTIGKSAGYTILSFIMGWWGIPWGPIYTIGALYTNLSGGKDVTNDIMNHIGANQAAPNFGEYNTPSGNNSQQSGGYNVPGNNSQQSGGYNVPGNNSQQSGGYNVPGNNNDSSTGNYNIPR